MRMKYFHQPLNVSSSMNRYSPMKFPIIENALNIKLMEKLEKESVVGEVLGCHSHSRTPNRRHSVSHVGEFHDPFGNETANKGEMMINGGNRVVVEVQVETTRFVDIKSRASFL